MLSMRLFFGFHDVEERVGGVRTRSCCLHLGLYSLKY